MKKESNNQELLEHKALVSKLWSVGHAPKLSRSQKKRMLTAAMGTQPLWVRLRPVAMSFALLLLLSTSLLTFVSKPGDTLYALKRKVEDARSIVQPSYDDTLIKRRQEEIEQLKNNGASDDDIKKAQEEKQKIEERRSGKKSGSNSADDSGSDDSSNETEHESEDHSESESGDDSKATSPTSQQSQSSSQDDSEDSNESEDSEQESSTQQSNASRDACKAALDLRKKNGENIPSDEYKKCE